MRAFVITLKDHPYSERVAARCIESARDVGHLRVTRFEATPAHEALGLMKRCRLEWTWGQNGGGLKHHPYGGRLEPRVGCAMSHYRLWMRCAETGAPLMVLEHDAVFMRGFAYFDFKSACQLNDPKGATRRGAWWSEQMEKRGPGVFPKTWVTRREDRIPDGLAGNSAYVLQPECAERLIELAHDVGLWPNDALMCAQLVDDLEEVYPFFTRVEQTESTSAA